MKPADISQEVWEEALAALPNPGDRFNEHGVTVSVARAIQRAVEREREEIEAMVDNMSFCTPDDDYQLGYTNCTEAVIDAIRARGGSEMKLWLLRPIEGDALWKPWYDKAFGFVVRAETESAARDLVAAGYDVGDEGKKAWLDSTHSTCVELSHDGESEIIIRDFAYA